MASLTVSTRIESKILKKLEKLSKATKRSKSYLAAEAIEKYVQEESWQIDAINEGIKEAEKGNFASDKELDNYLTKWGISGN